MKSFGNCAIATCSFRTPTDRLKENNCYSIDYDIEEMGIKIGGKLVSNLRYADGTTLWANSQEEKT